MLPLLKFQITSAVAHNAASRPMRSSRISKIMLAADTIDLFNFLTGYSAKRDYQKLLVAPVNLREGLEALIKREIQRHESDGKGHLGFKMNALVDPGIIMKMLDAGAYGIICPMVNTRADAERFVSAMRYPPQGSRSFGPIRALLHAGADYPQHANATVIAFAMVETRQALDNLDEILSVEGLDAIYIGPADLSLALGCTPRFDQEEQPVVEAIDLILAKAREHGVVPCIHNGTPEYARKMVEKGFRFVTVASDARLMAAGAQQVVARMREEPAQPLTGSTSY